VVIWGGLARLGEILLEPLRQSIHRRTLVTSIAPAKVTTSQLGPRAVAVGAATLVLQKALADVRHFPVTAAAGR
jgi:predicted NBD/HSP70 family sugar kinase